GNATAWTNQDVILTANVSDGVVEYFDGKNWVAGSTLTVSENGTYTFRVTDEAGNVTEKEIIVDKIDKVAPTLEVSGNATEWTNNDVILTANVSDGVVEYFDGENWVAGSTLTVSENGTYTFRVTDEAGNVTEKEVVVDKIDKVAPTLEVSGNATEWTNQDVILTANVSDGVVEYFDGENWIAGSTLTVSENGTYQFRVTDLAGNVTEKEVVVDKIDKVAPTLEVSGNTTAWTNKDVVLTANVSDGVVEYFDGKSWIAGSTLTATENGTYQFRVTDLAGNVTTKEIVVDKIDKVAPTLEVSGNATEWTNQDVILTANVSDGVVEYFDGENWVAGSTLTATENGTYQFRVTDEAGNVTEKSVEVTFIDKDAPVISEISADITELTNSAIKVSALFNDSNNFSVQYRINDGAWLDYNDYIIMENNGIVYFKAEDIAGNVTEAQYIVSNIDRTTAEAPVITVEKRAYLSNNPLIVTAEFAENAVTKEYSFNGIDWISYAEQVIVRENGFIFFRSCDAIGNYSVVGKAEVSGIDHVADSSLTDYVFVKSNYTEKNTKNKKQNGIMLTFSENAFNTLADFEHSAAYKVVMLDNNINIFAATDLSDLSVISGVAAVPTVKKKVNSYSYSAKANARGTLNIIEKNTDDVLFKDFANVNIYGNAIAGIVDGGKSANSQTIKTSVKKAVTTVIETNKVSQTASGKANVNGAFVKTLSNYATVNIESGTVENIVNNAYKLTKNIKNVGGNNSEIKYTEQFTASGTVKLTNGAHTDTISNYKTVKITDSNVGKIESFAVSKIVNGAENRKLAGSVTLLRASVDTIENYAKLTMTDSVAAAVANVRKIAVNKGFSSIENYIGTSENDTLTIGKNAVLVLSGANFGIGSDKIVNSGTLIFASDFVLNAEKIINKGNFAATSDVWENLNGKIVGLLNLGQTYEGFRNVKYELADNTAKKAVKWDLKSDYTGWLSGDSDCIDTVDFVKFKTGKESSIIEISGFSGSDTISLVDKKGNVAELTFADGVFKAELAAKTDYILELGISKGDDSMSYTLAVV
ncbi:MAG: hypothetical protein IKB71_11675, partial [Lentisphaeria bacterium]|nr:hypothetical protein [Lentisphaeria bacterium]